MPHSISQSTAHTDGQTNKSGEEQEATAADIQAQIDVSVAQVRQLVSSWLPSISAAETTSALDTNSPEAEISVYVHSVILETFSRIANRFCVEKGTGGKHQ
jgi:hypothetical protein